MTKLTSTQAKALEFIRSSIELGGVAPTLREISAYMGYKAVGSAQDIVAALRRKGFIEEATRQSARSFALTSLARYRGGSTLPQPEFSFDLAQNTLVVPLLGQVPAGNPALAVEERIGTIRLAWSLLAKPYPKPDEVFALQATGDSMVGAGILDGDFLVVKMDKEPPKRSIVVARVAGEVTVKRLMRDPAHGWYLKPENPNFDNIYVTSEGFEIIGKVVALQRAIQ